MRPPLNWHNSWFLGSSGGARTSGTFLLSRSFTTSYKFRNTDFYRSLCPIHLLNPWLLIFLCNLWYSSSLLSFESQKSSTLLMLGFIFAVNSTACMSVQWEARDNLPPHCLTLHPCWANRQTENRTSQSLPLLWPVQLDTEGKLDSGFLPRPHLQWWPALALTPMVEIWRHSPCSPFSYLPTQVLLASLPSLLSSLSICLHLPHRYLGQHHQFFQKWWSSSYFCSSCHDHSSSTKQPGFLQHKSNHGMSLLKSQWFPFLRLKPKLSLLVYMIWPLPTPSSSSTAYSLPKVIVFKLFQAIKLFPPPALCTSAWNHLLGGPPPDRDTSWLSFFQGQHNTHFLGEMLYEPKSRFL